MSTIRSTLLASALVACAAAHAQTTLYSHLSLSRNSIEIYGDWDGGAADIGAGTNYGLQAGQVFTSSITGALTSVEAIEDSGAASPAVNGVLVQLFNFSGGVVGSLVGQQETTGTVVGLGHSAFFNNTWQVDITSTVNIPGLVASHQYLAVLQGQGPNWGLLDTDLNGDRGTYIRDHSSFGYSPAYGLPSWTETGAAGDASGDALMRIQGVAPVPEPSALAALGLGAVAAYRRRRR